MIKVYQLQKAQNNYEVVLYYKGVGVKVLFEDGNTYKGLKPKCYVRDPFRQLVIERSELFKSGEVILERTIPEASDNKQKKPAAKVPISKPDKPVATETSQADAETVETSQADEKPTVSDGEAADATAEGAKDMDFGSLSEAILYVAQNFQQAVSTDKEVREVLKANGIIPHIKKG